MFRQGRPTPVKIRSYFELLAAAWLALTSLQAQSQVPSGSVDTLSLYTVEVPVERGERDAQAAAERLALEEVLIRITGSVATAQSADVLGLFPNPRQYVLRFRPGANESLLVTFDGEAIEDLLRQAGHAVWGADRPVTLVWLAVDWGQGEREMVAAGDPRTVRQPQAEEDRNAELRERLQAAAQRQGLPILFPAARHPRISSK